MDSPALLTPHFVRAVKIKVVSIFIDEFNIPEDVMFKIDFNRTFNVDVNQDLFILNLKITYSIPQNEKQRIVLDSMVHNVFEIQNIKSFLDPTGTVRLPIELLSTIVGLSVTQSRGVISVHTAGTPMGDTLIPIVNPLELTKALFDEAEIEDLAHNTESVDLALTPYGEKIERDKVLDELAKQGRENSAKRIAELLKEDKQLSKKRS